MAMAIPKKVKDLLEKLIVSEENSPGRSYAVAPLLEMLRDDELTKEDKEHLIRYYNFRKRFLDTGRGDPYPADHHDTRLVVDIPGDTFREIIPILAECLTFAGEDIEDFLWVLLPMSTNAGLCTNGCSLTMPRREKNCRSGSKNSTILSSRPIRSPNRP